MPALPSRPDLAPLPDPPPADARTRWTGALGFAAAVVLGLGIGWLASGWLDGLDVSGVELTLASTLGVLGVLAVHELGHVAGAQLAGWRFALFVAGPLRVERRGDRLTWGLNRSLGLAGGLALSLPTDGDDLRRKTALMVAGGPLASVALSALGLAVGGAWALVGVFSLGIAAVTLFPGRTGGFLTDGARLLRLARGGPVADREAAVLAVFAQSLDGTRPRDWDPSLVARLDLEDGDLIEESALALRTAHALDRGDAEAARAALARRVELWALVPESLRGGLAADAALFEGGIRGDAEAAGAWVERIPERALLADPAGVALARAAADPADASAHLDAARAALADTFDAGTAAARRDWIDGPDPAATA